MKKNKNDYFEMIKNQVQYCVDASMLLEKMMSDFSSDAIPVIRDEMHEIEHKADELHHEILTKLSVEFITPIDQEDILRLVQIIDDVTDAIDEVVLDFYMYTITAMPDNAKEFAMLVNRCAKALLTAADELKNFKKPTKLRSLLVDINTIEGEADNLYTELIHNLFANTQDAKTLIGAKAVYESMENCCDLCEHASDVIEQIVIKNT